MNVASAIVLAIVLALAALAVWRNARKGVPCEGGCPGKGACACGGCRRGGARGAAI